MQTLNLGKTESRSEAELVRICANWRKAEGLSNLLTCLTCAQSSVEDLTRDLNDEEAKASAEKSRDTLRKIHGMVLGGPGPDQLDWKLKTDEDLVEYLEEEFAKAKSPTGKGTKLDDVFPKGTKGLSLEQRLATFLSLKEVKDMAREGKKLAAKYNL